jgi:hypothetical protein
MSRARVAFTLIIVAAIAMLLGLVAGTLVTRHLAPPPSDARPEATEPHRAAGTVVNV